MKHAVCALALCGLAVVAADAASPKELKVEVQGGGSTLALGVPMTGFVSAGLVVVGPNGFRVEQTFAGNEAIAVDLGEVKHAKGQALAFGDGEYRWELRIFTPMPRPGFEVPDKENKADDVASANAPPARLDTWLAHGRFKVEGEGIVPIAEERRRATAETVSSPSAGGKRPPANADSVRPQTHYADNLYIGGGICAGCSDGDADLLSSEVLAKAGSESDLTLRNLVEDTGWRWRNVGNLLLAQFRNDYSGITTPLVVAKDTPSHTLYLDSTGSVGVGTSTPERSLDVLPPGGGSGTAALLLDDGNGTNALLYNNVNGFIGLSNGVFCSLCITPTPSPAFALVLDGANIGIGTSTPAARLHVVQPAGNADLRFDGSASANFLLNRGNTSSFSRFQFLTSGGLKWSLGMINDGSHNFHLGPNISTTYFFVNQTNGRVGIGTKTPAYPLQMGSGAYVTAGGVWTSVSSRESKQEIEDLSAEAAEAAVAKLNPVTFTYKAAPDEHHVGFIAEDVPELVATPDRKGMSALDVVAVLTKVVQDQETQLSEQQRLMKEQQEAIAQLAAKVAKLEQAK